MTLESILRGWKNFHVSEKQPQNPDYLTEKNQRPQENNQELMDEVAAVQKKLVRPGAVAGIEMKANKTIARITLWLFSLVQKDLR